MTVRRTSCLSILVLTFLAAICIALFLGGMALVQIPARAQAIFGPPDSALTTFQRYYLAAMLLSVQRDLTQPQDPSGIVRPFEIASGESVSSVSNRLNADALIPNPAAFRDFLAYAGLDRTVKAGEHELSPSLTPIEIARLIQNPFPDKVTLNILAGWRLEEIAASLPETGLRFTPQGFLNTALNPARDSAFPPDLPPGATLEGYLMPGSYTIERKTSARQFIQMALDNFQSQVDPSLLQAYANQGLTLHQAVALASIVEREAVLDDEMPQIASVFHNRLANGMKLDSDPTVQYALGYNHSQGTWWTNPLSAANLEVRSLYNTYGNPGLPPGPIANPSLAALKAVANPAQTPYYYFRAACNGSSRHVFAVTFAEHVQNACP